MRRLFLRVTCISDRRLPAVTTGFAVTVGLAVTVAAFPAFAAVEAEFPLWGFYTLLAFFLPVALIGGGFALVKLWRRLQVSERLRSESSHEVLMLRSLVDLSPDPCLVFTKGEERPIVPEALARLLGLDRSADMAALAACFEDQDGERFSAAVEGLRKSGLAFDLSNEGLGMMTRQGLALRLIGCSSSSGTAPVDCVWFRDISRESVQMDEWDRLFNALIDERDRLRRLIDILPIPVWWRDNDLNLDYCNIAYGHAVEADPDTALAEKREIASGLIGSSGLALAERAKLTRLAQSESHPIIIDGARRLLEFNEVPLGELGGIAGYARDFSEIEDVHKELERHIAAHAEVLENVNVAMAIFGGDKRLKFANTAYARLWRFDQDWLAGEPDIGEILEALYEKRKLPEYADFRAFRQGQAALFTSLIEPREEMLHLPDGMALRSLVSPHPFGGLIFTFEDVTDRLALERSYNTLIDTQRETLNNLYEGIAVFGNDGRLKLSNPAYARIWDIPEAMLGNEPHINEIVELTRKFSPNKTAWKEARAWLVGNVTNPEASSGHFLRDDDVILEYATVPLPDGNVLLTYHDITDHYRVEQALRERAEAMEATARLKSEFIANVSYELRTPLNTVIGFADILGNQYFGSLTERQLEYCKGILDSSQHLMTLVNDILDLAAIEAGYLKLERKTVDVRSMLTSAMNLIKERAFNRDVELNFESGDDLANIYVDARRIKQAVFNLLSNAIKFTLSGGSVTLSATRSADALRISGSDTGIGMPEEDYERIFEKFERGGDGEARGGGPGLGLALVKHFVELHDGHIGVESPVDEGTTVWISLPVVAAPLDAANESAVDQVAAIISGVSAEKADPSSPRPKTGTVSA